MVAVIHSITHEPTTCWSWCGPSQLFVPLSEPQIYFMWQIGKLKLVNQIPNLKKLRLSNKNINRCSCRSNKYIMILKQERVRQHDRSLFHFNSFLPYGEAWWGKRGYCVKQTDIWLQANISTGIPSPELWHWIFEVRMLLDPFDQKASLYLTKELHLIWLFIVKLKVTRQQFFEVETSNLPILKRGNSLFPRKW